MKDVFISYKTEEFEEASWVKSVLENNGISCWMAPESIPGGSSYAIEIPKAIRECKAFVLILSSRSQASQWVSREVDRAINEGKIILPFMLENCALKDDFNFYLTNVQRYAAYESKTKAIEKMLKEIKAILGVEVSVKNVSAEEPIAQPSEKIVTPTTEPKKDNNQPKQIASLINTKKVKSKSPNQKRKLMLAIVAITVVLAIVVGIIAFSGGDDISNKGSSNTIIIAGEKFNKYDFSISLDNKELTSEDLEKFSDFNDISGIYLTDCTFPSTDISAVFECAEYVVSLENCGLTTEHLNSVDFESLDISVLRLGNNLDLSDLSMLSSLYSLTELKFNNCAVSDISFISNLYDLKILSADYNFISDISSLAKCVNLETLSLSNNQIVSLQPLSELKELKSVTVKHNKLSDLTGLENSLLIEFINAGNNNITSIDGLRNCTQLSDVALNENNISDISVLSKSSEKLSRIDLRDNAITDISQLAECIKLGELLIDNNQLTNLDALAKCTELDKLSASNNQINDINGIGNCLFSSLNLANNKINSTDDITFVSGDVYGAKLDLSNNQITELILNIDGNGTINFGDIRLYGNNISDFSALSRISSSKLAFEYNENIDFIALAERDYYNYYVINCPLDKQVNIGEILGSYRTEFVTEQEFLQSQKSE